MAQLRFVLTLLTWHVKSPFNLAPLSVASAAVLTLKSGAVKRMLRGRMKMPVWIEARPFPSVRMSCLAIKPSHPPPLCLKEEASAER